MADAPKPSPGSLLKRSELLLSVAILGLLVVFLVPLPPLALDLLLFVQPGRTTILVLLITLTRPAATGIL